MTAKESRALRKLQIENEELKRHFHIAQKSQVDTFTELYQTRTALRQAYEALSEAQQVLEALMKEDPAFMAQFP